MDPKIFYNLAQDLLPAMRKNKTHNRWYAVLRIHDILVRIFKIIFAYYFLKSQSSRNQAFSYYFCLVIEGSGSGTGSGSIPLTNGSGSGSRRPKNRSHKAIEIKGYLFFFAWLQKAPDPYLQLMDPDPDPGGPKTCGSGSATLVIGPTQHELQVENPRPLMLQLRHRIVHTLSPSLDNVHIKKKQKSLI